MAFIAGRDNEIAFFVWKIEKVIKDLSLIRENC